MLGVTGGRRFVGIGVASKAAGPTLGWLDAKGDGT